LNLYVMLKKFLGIAFMCHQKPERSFFFRGKQFPLCARCTGILIGYIFGIVIATATDCNGYTYYVMLILPMIADGLFQNCLGIESNNVRRLITGIMGGIGIIYIFFINSFFYGLVSQYIVGKMGNYIILVFAKIMRAVKRLPSLFSSICYHSTLGRTKSRTKIPAGFCPKF